MIDTTEAIQSLTAQRYPAYKDSGVDWLGEIPAHWGVKKVTHIFRKIGSGTTPASGNPKYYDGAINWLQTGDLTDGLIKSTSKTITQKAVSDHSALKIYPKNSLVIAMYGATIGKTGLLNIEAATNQACCVLSEPDSLKEKYAFYFFIVAKNHIVSLGYGGGQPNISQDVIKSLRLPVPPLTEQTRIAEFLDRKTAQIDQAIAQKERLIELLNERRQVLIHRAVTRGLNPDAPMKNSGIDWIGEIPAHWEVKRLKHNIDVLSGFAFKSSQYSNNPNDIKLLRGVNINPGTLNWDETVYWPVESSSKFERYMLQEQDLVIGMDRPWVSTGIRVAQVKRNDLPCLLLQRTARIKGKENMDTQYVKLLLTTQGFVEYFEPILSGVSVPHISPEQIENFTCAIPPLDEQRAICNFIQESHKAIDKVQKKQVLAIHKLQELKSTLINSAVTGKIKV